MQTHSDYSSISKASASTYSHEILSGWDTLESMRAEIVELESHAAHRNIFFDFDWITSWHNQLSSGRGQNNLGGETVFIALYDESDTLVAFWPFFQVPGIKRPGLWPVACQSGDYYEPVVSSLDPSLLLALAKGIKELWKTHSFVWLPIIRQYFYLEHLEAALKKAGLWIHKRKRSTNSFIQIPQHESAEDYFAHCMGTKTRQTLDRKKRRLAERGTISIESFETREHVKRALPVIAKIEDANWKTEHGLGLFSKSGLKKFYFEVLPSLAERQKARVSILYINKKPIAYEMALIDGMHYLMHNLAYLPDYKSYSPGIQLLMGNIAWCFDQKFATYDFLQGSADYKSRFANTEQPLLDLTLLPRNIVGTLHYLLVSLFQRKKK
ncbi:MAG: GNAT family N-acetyltransferase [Opitutales bacterium]|nr:GNAT family N-acetyltransferase [Opitutales bacterium]NRA27538.1 GNAT family N-acetyltransferase [Opitutales bacterium]